MRVVYKYPLHFIGSGHVVAVDLPKDAEILRVDKQDGDCYLWALVNAHKSSEQRKFVLYGTGTEIDKDLNLKYVNTFFDTFFVWHIFEVLP
jgi:hypothetical protein